NTTSVAVVESIVLGGDEIDLKLPAGPFVQVTVLGGQLTVGSGLVLSGDISVVNQTVDGNAETGIAVAKLALTYQGNGITGGTGGVLTTSGGLAGFLSGTLSVAAGGFSVGGSLGLRINTTTAAVNRNLFINGQKVAIVFSSSEVAGANGPFVSVFGGGV